MDDAKQNGRFVKGCKNWRPKRIFSERSYLEQQYVELKRTTGDIAKEHNVTRASVLYWLKCYRIPRRQGLVASKCRKPKYDTPHSLEEMREYEHFKRLAFPEKYRERNQRHYKNNRERILASSAKWRNANRDRFNKITDNFRRNNLDKYRGYDRKRRSQRASYTREKRANDLNFKLASVLRGQIRRAIKGQKRIDHTLSLLGCSVESFKLYLESKFEIGMSWENYGRGEGTWQIDHIMPCAIFDLSNPGHQTRCFHFSNMQPMWTVENQRKNKKLGYKVSNL